ncbi:A disintegrin and metalloproteinase with thrombospondin motifs 8-like [Aphidius gifuensis]|uniref:A disintegrin and metalloproteinase with thrombospondin motifs 8-like n=1 Tax=Aphidius gifuensis TaxID=684658 RepID=UPI001CDC99DC|nr:A disintegrin and metalloproteinase with thrombospondin motifs 8-like [Aphidius gifuensis]
MKVSELTFLEHLEFCGSSGLDDYGLINIIHNSCNLKYLGIKKCHSLTKNALAEIKKLKNESKVTDIGIKNVIKNCPSIEKLYVSYTKITVDSLFFAAQETNKRSTNIILTMKADDVIKKEYEKNSQTGSNVLFVITKPREAMPEKTKSKENSRTRREIKSFDDDFSSRRVRRQIPEDQTNQYFINIIVYADTSMSDNYGNELELKIEKINEDFSDEHKYGFDKPLMDNFCQWQSTQRNNRNMQNNSYVPLLLTRNRLFPVSHKDKHAIGMANVSSICDTNLSCTGVQDGPYSTASVIAHEIGHLLGIKHDYDNNIYSCWTKDEDESLYLMSKVDKKQTFKWSNCSNEYLTQFLESGGGDCLLAKPREKFDETRYRHLGEQYSLNKTCEFAFGRRYYARELDDRDKCGIFKCYKNQELGYFEYRSLMVPDGTTCGDNKICYEGECMSSNKLKPVNGGWSDYGDFSECSRTCGGGIKMKYRYCNNPTPMYGGQYCLGNKKYYEICASNKCPHEESQDFRFLYLF